MSFIYSATNLLRYELCQVQRSLNQTTLPLLFFILVICLFVLGVGPEPKQLTLLAPSLCWITAHLASLLSFDRLFQADYEDGTLEQMILSHRSLTGIVAIKAIAHWLTTGLPIVILTPVLGIMLDLSFITTKLLVITLLLGTPSLSLIGAFAAALTVGLKRTNGLVPLLVLPLLIPLLILGINTVVLGSDGLPVIGQLALLLAYLLFTISLFPFMIAAALRLST